MDATHTLQSRYVYGSNGCPSGWYRSGNYCYRNRSSFYSWGRWVLVGVLIFFALVFLFLCACCARRRSRKGAKPMYGTGWMGGNKWGGNNNANQMNTYDNQQAYPQQQYPPPQQGGFDPQYNQGAYQPTPNYGQPQQPQNTGTTFNPNDGYYGNQQPQYGAPQHPPNTYQPEGGYAPPAGPPPGK